MRDEFAARLKEIKDRYNGDLAASKNDMMARFKKDHGK